MFSRFGSVLAATLLVAATIPAAAQREPYGQDIQGWRFTQSLEGGSVLCRAVSPGPTSGVVIQRRVNGAFFIAVQVRGVRDGMHEAASFEVGRNAEPVNIRAQGGWLLIPLDDQMIGRVVRQGGFLWAINGRRQTGDVVFTTAVGAAVNRLRECTRANGGR